MFESGDMCMQPTFGSYKATNLSILTFSYFILQAYNLTILAVTLLAKIKF